MRIAQLDVMRFVAVFLVLGRHFPTCPPETSYLAWALTGVWHRGGWIGVDLFFVLSGFLVSGLLFREYQQKRDVGATRFLIRRGFKIYPAFWVVLSATVIVALSSQHRLPGSALVGEVLFLQNYVGAIWNHTWSLAVEEHFYFGLALLATWLCRRNRGAADPFSGISAVFLVVGSLCLAVRIVLNKTTQYAEPTHLL